MFKNLTRAYSIVFTSLILFSFNSFADCSDMSLKKLERFNKSFCTGDNWRDSAAEDKTGCTCSGLAEQIILKEDTGSSREQCNTDLNDFKSKMTKFKQYCDANDINKRSRDRDKKKKGYLTVCLEKFESCGKGDLNESGKTSKKENEYAFTKFLSQVDINKEFKKAAQKYGAKQQKKINSMSSAAKSCAWFDASKEDREKHIEALEESLADLLDRQGDRLERESDKIIDQQKQQADLQNKLQDLQKQMGELETQLAQEKLNTESTKLEKLLEMNQRIIQKQKEIANNKTVKYKEIMSTYTSQSKAAEHRCLQDAREQVIGKDGIYSQQNQLRGAGQMKIRGGFADLYKFSQSKDTKKESSRERLATELYQKCLSSKSFKDEIANAKRLRDIAQDALRNEIAANTQELNDLYTARVNTEKLIDAAHAETVKSINKAMQQTQQSYQQVLQQLNQMNSTSKILQAMKADGEKYTAASEIDQKRQALKDLKNIRDKSIAEDDFEDFTAAMTNHASLNTHDYLQKCCDTHSGINSTACGLVESVKDWGKSDKDTKKSRGSGSRGRR